ncbi:hypothetical protein [Acinetobacter sp. CWB-B33]|uniref:hypothetical protein n=1 Tax=Acinetobacter sp. CWB-B33 TaxID=2815724 RepID=UPI0031FE5329
MKSSWNIKARIAQLESEAEKNSSCFGGLITKDEPEKMPFNFSLMGIFSGSLFIDYLIFPIVLFGYGAHCSND